MTHQQVGEFWERNAPAWTHLARQGYDVYRDLVNTPAFLAILPDVAGLCGLDVGCGEGHNTRLLTQLGASMFAVDIALGFVRAAATCAPSIPHAAGSAQQLPFAPATFDFATAFMSLMDLPDPAASFQEIYRVLRPGGFLQFSISHPCFSTIHRRLLRDARGRAFAVEVGRYFDRADGRIERWIFSSAPPEIRAGLPLFEVPLFHRTLAEWLNMIVAAGFAIEHVSEPKAGDALAENHPAVQDTQVVAYFLHVRCRKPPV